MIYSDVINNNWHTILPKKAKYTKADIDRVMVHSLFKPFNGRTLSEREARFIVLCTAIYHDADWSKFVGQYHRIMERKAIKGMLR
jgi:hypothetical protein